MERKKGLPSYPGSKLLYSLIGILSVLEAMSIIAQAFFLARVITFLFQGSSLSEVTTEILFFFLSFAFRYAITFSIRALAERYSIKTTKYLRNKLINAYFNNGTKFVSSHGTPRLVLLAIEGMDQLKEYLQIAIPRMIRTMIVPFLLVIYIFTIDKVSAIILVVTVPIVIIFMILLGLAAQKMADKQYETYRILSNHFVDSLKGLETLKFLGESKAHERKITKVSDDYRKATNKTLRVAFLSSFALDFFTSLSIAFVAVSLGLRLIDGVTTLLPALTILILAPEYFLPIRQVGKDYHATLDGQVAMQQMEDIFNRVQQPITAKHTETLNWDENQVMTIENVNLAIEKDMILKDLNFSWQGPGFIGLVGKSGAGKSTFIHFLAGFLQHQSGDVFINQQNIGSFQREDWLDKIAYIPQHPYIFPTSLAHNIRFYEPEASDAEVTAIVKEIGLESFVSQLPKGIHEPIGEGGRMLSGGQEQRVAIARALLSNRPIILLDEPTAHLDVETEYELKHLMTKVFAGKLVFFATHRKHWMKHMDELLIIDKQTIVERGTHEELYAKNGTYKQLIYGKDG